MHVPHAVTTPTASLLPLVLSFMLTLTSGSDRGWGMEAAGEGQKVGGGRMRLSEMGRYLLQETGSAELCNNARLQCTVRTGCQMALTNFFEGCHSILAGEELRCTTTCQHALVSLLTTEDGAGLAFIHCNCSGQDVCEERKKRVQVCQRHVLHSMDLVRDQEATLSCTLARWICEADTSCLAALQYYVQHCSKLFTGTRCTARCRNSVRILYRQPNADKLRTCRCEGDEDYDCPSLVNNTERLCLQRHRHGRNDSFHHHHYHHHLRDYDEADGFRQPGARAAHHRLFRRRQRRNKPGRKKPGKRPPSPSDSVPSKTKRGRRVLKRRAGPGRRKIKVKVRRSRRRRCTGRRGEWRKKRRSSRKGAGRRKGKPCRSQRTSTKLRSTWLRKLKKLTRSKERETQIHASSETRS